MHSKKIKEKTILLIDVNFDKIPDYQKAAAANGRIMLKNEATAKAVQKPAAYTAITISPAVANEIFKAANTTLSKLCGFVRRSTNVVSNYSKLKLWNNWVIFLPRDYRELHLNT